LLDSLLQEKIMEKDTDAEVHGMAEGYHMLDSLLHEVESADTELSQLRKELDGLSIDENHQKDTEEKGLSEKARLMKEEIKLFKVSPPESLVEDLGMRYHIAVGMLEQEISELKDVKRISENKIENNQEVLTALRNLIEYQKKLNKRMEDIVAQRKQYAASEEGRKSARLQAENKLRATKQATLEFKTFLVEFVNKIGPLEENINEGDVPIGYLLQKLWTEFQTNDKDGYINVQDLSFEVRSKDVAKLREAGIIKEMADNKNMIQLVDFTMRN